VNLHGLAVLLFLSLGAAHGAAYLGVLAWNVDLYCRDSNPAPAVLVHLLRFLGSGVIFVAIAQMGAVPLLSSLFGFQLARVLAIRIKLLTWESAS
jgi:hypothetical protein